jgi:hypothetical protein
MKFKVGSAVSVSATCLQGYVETTYAHLLRILGKPTCMDGDKTTCEWDIEFHDGTVATVYDWKTDCTPTGLYNWHVGGNNPRSVALIGLLLKAPIRYGW